MIKISFGRSSREVGISYARRVTTGRKSLWDPATSSAETVTVNRLHATSAIFCKLTYEK